MFFPICEVLLLYILTNKILISFINRTMESINVQEKRAALMSYSSSAKSKSAWLIL